MSVRWEPAQSHKWPRRLLKGNFASLLRAVPVCWLSLPLRRSCSWLVDATFDGARLDYGGYVKTELGIPALRPDQLCRCSGTTM